MNGDMVREIRLALKQTQLELSLRMNVDKRTVQRWERGEAEIIGPAIVLLNQLKEEAFRAASIEPDRIVKRPKWRRRKYPKR